MKKAECLQIESAARQAIGRQYSCSPISRSLCCGEGGRVRHEFDIYAEGILIGGVSTSPPKNKSGSSNTGGQDRASAALLWLELWRGTEKRIHVLTSKPMADWLVAHFQGALFRNPITIYHYDQHADVLHEVGRL